MEQNNQKPEFIYMKRDEDELKKTLCYFEKDDSGQIVKLLFEDDNFEQLLLSKFIQFLDNNKEKEIKIITTLGEFGQGKSFIQNFLISKYQNRSDYLMVFPSSQDIDSITKGIQFYAIENNNKVVVFFDCEGFDYSDKSNYMQSLEKLVCLICRISTVILYVHQNSRQPKSLEKILKLINIQEHNNTQIVNNFVEVINKCNGDKIQSYQNNYKNFIQKVFKCQQLDFNDEFDNQLYSCKIKNDEKFNKFIQQIEEIQQLCEKSQYKTPFENCKAFEKKQNCRSFKEMLICCFQIIKEGIQGNVNVNQFISIINYQLAQKQIFPKIIEECIDKIKSKCSIQAKKLLELQIKSHISYALFDFLTISYQTQSEIKLSQEFEKCVQKWKIEFQTKLKDIFTNNQTLLSDENAEIIINHYSNLESIKPEEIRVYELMKKKQNEKINFLDLFKIFIISFFFFLIPSSIFIFDYDLIKNLLNKRKIQSINNYLIQSVIEYSRQKRFEKNKTSQNIQHLRNILEQKFRANLSKLINNQEDQDMIIFIIYFNLMQKSLSFFSGNQKTFEIDYKILQSCIQILQDQNIEFVDLEEIYDSEHLDIVDQDFEFFEQQRTIIFKSNNLQNQSLSVLTRVNQREEQFYKHLIILKNRNESLFLSIFYYAYFQDLIYSENFANKMFDTNFVAKIIQVQNSLF